MCQILIKRYYLQSLFRSDHIPYKVSPVSGYDDLFKANEAIAEERNDVSFFFLQGIFLT